MNWSNVKLIFQRETKDQLRDRRTLFTIVVLPMLLYPLLGMTFMQISQFMREHPTRVWVIGSSFLPFEPPLLIGDRFASDFATDDDNRLMSLVVDEYPPVNPDVSLAQLAQERIQSGEYDAVLVFHPDFGDRLNAFREALKRTSADQDEIAPLELASVRAPAPEVFFNTANDKSRIASQRVRAVIQAWRRSLVRSHLQETQVPPEVTDPFDLLQTDVAEDQSRRAAAWSKILPFVLLVWSLTGAFYPAVDLCAGEKERGTLETLLSSPALRSEIVWGKLLTVILFSMATSLLNLLSMGCTGYVIIQQITSSADPGMAGATIGPPPMIALVWLIPALLPASALFSALAMAIASFARSSKEGQYYLLPLLMITLPLMMLPMLPAAQLDLGTSLIPVSGLMMLLRTLIEGQYREAMVYFPVVAAITLVCCLLAIRWAVEQFRNESVLFRESERFGLGLWFRHLVRDRGDTPSVGEAVACGVVLLLIRFFAGFLATAPTDFGGFVTLMCVTQIALIAFPPVCMAFMLTRSPRKTLLLHWPRWSTIPAAALLALLLHPAFVWMSEGIRVLYPIGPETLEQLRPLSLLIAESPLVYVLLLMALLPAVCEELAFRGFVLSGLRHVGRKWVAIVVSSLFFGLAHGLLQQSLSACVVGVVIGFVAIQTGSLLPAIVFHFTHNSLAILLSRAPESWFGSGWLGAFAAREGESVLYHWPFALGLAAAAAMLLWWFRQLPHHQYAEESLQESIDRARSSQTMPAP